MYFTQLALLAVTFSLSVRAMPAEQTSKPEYLWLTGLDMSGQWIKEFPAEYINGCIDACSADESCKVSIYNYNSKMCHFKGQPNFFGVSNSRDLVTTVKLPSDYKTPDFKHEPNHDYYGGDFLHLPWANFYHCVNICELIPECKGFSLQKEGNSRGLSGCYLKSSLPNPQTSDHADMFLHKARK